jgi:hypothetical protein
MLKGVFMANARLEKNCKQCQKLFMAEKRQLYCSFECGRKSLSKPKIERICEACNKIFLLRASQLNRSTPAGKYCSKECRSDGKKTTIECICLYCNGKFYKPKWEVDKGENKFCSKKCTYTYRVKPGAEKICNYCQSIFLATHKQIRLRYDKYCSSKCFLNYKESLRPKKIIKPKLTIEDIFFENIIFPTDPNDCWEFKKLDARGYGAIYHEGKVVKAHRFSYAYFVNKIPDGMMICHHCDNAKCVNFLHIYAGTAKDNARDMIERGKTKHIGQGHWKNRKTTRG